jgi:hypothetical protein
MVERLAKQKEEIGVNDPEAKQKQASPELQKEQQSNQSQKQLFAATNQEGQNIAIAPDGATIQTSNNASSKKGDDKIDTTKIAAAMEIGTVLSEISIPASGMAVPSTAVAAAHAAPVAIGLAFPLFGPF